MKSGFFFLFFYLSTSFCKAALVTGLMQNGAPGEQVELHVPHYFIDGKSSRYTAVLDGQSKFAVRAEITEPQAVYLFYGDSRLTLFLAPEDTLHIRSDHFRFPLSVQFSGKAAANNRLLQTFYRERPPDYNEFNNLRFKIGQYWAPVEERENALMESMPPALYKSYTDSLKKAAFVMLDEFDRENPDALSYAFREWLSHEIIYEWGYNLLVYGQIYGGRHQVQPEFFDFLYEAPHISETIGSAWYRAYLMALIARQQYKKDPEGADFFPGQYQLSAEILAGKSLAFFRSEMIGAAFSKERFREILPLYVDFLKTNKFTEYDRKVEDLYQKYARVSPGAAAPDFSSTDIDGLPLRLKDYRGKTVYLNFWASWCNSCLVKMDFFSEFEAELSMHQVAIVNISIDANAENWRQSVAERGFKGKHVLSGSASGADIGKLYGVEAVPQYFIIGKNGEFMPKAASGQPNEIREHLLRLTGSN